MVYILNIQRNLLSSNKETAILNPNSANHTAAQCPGPVPSVPNPLPSCHGRRSVPGRLHPPGGGDRTHPTESRQDHRVSPAARHSCSIRHPGDPKKCHSVKHT
eukprot:763468-Hanusia_phi.AAC.2